MSSSALIERKYYSLYIGNLSRDIRQRDLAEYLERFDQVDQIQLFEANYRRWTSFAFVLMRTPDSINRLMATRPHFLNNRRLVRLSLSILGSFMELFGCLLCIQIIFETRVAR